MNKNLKKVISAVAALALSVTSFAALGTASYSDVTADIKHASAINQLSAMGIIEGFEDGTFHPDEKVTRAQMAAMVVRALNIDNAESNKVQKFNDVPADNWAAGWIATATDRGILNGTGNGNFDPGLDVTYMQAAKMLVCAIGYESWAARNGGWPSGYRTYANSVGITAGISGAADDTALTRAQCAQMIANTLEAPMLVEDSMTTDYQGNPVALRVQKDGTNEDKSPFTSLLIDKWDMYVVNGKVTDSTKTEETGTAPKVRYQIEKTKNYLGTPYNTSSMYNNVVADATNNRYEAPQCLYGETGADAYLNLYTRAIIKADDYSDPEIIYIEEAGKSESITFEARLYKDGTYKVLNPGTAKQITTIDVKRSASSGTATTYKLVNGYSISVNGVNVAGTQANFEKYVRDNTYATVTLTDNPTNGTSTDGVYDVVTVDYKAIAVVDEVFEKSGDIVINFKDQARTDNAAKLEIDTESDKIYKFTKDGVAIEPTELVENDVLSISFNPSTLFKDSAFYEVEVSQQTTTGKVTGLSQDSFGVDEYTIDGTAYSIVDGMSPSIKTGGEYTIGLTADGRIAWADRTAVSINYGIIERVYKSAAGEPTVRIIDKTGVKRTYEYAGNADQATPSEDPTGIINRIYKAPTNNLTTIPLVDRVVDYTITSSNEIKIKSDVQNIVKSIENNKEYRESTGRLGSAVIDDATVILDISDWASDFSKSAGLASKAALMDGSYYSAVVAKEYGIGGSTAVPFVAIYEGLGGWSVDSPMAIVTKTLTTSEDGQTRTQLNVIENGEEKALVCEDDSAKYNLAEGTAFLYTTDTDGYVNDVVEVLTVDLASATKYDFYKEILANEADNELSAKEMANTGIINPVLYNSGAVGSVMKNGSDYVEFVFAPVLNKTSSDVTIGGLTYGTVPNLKTYLTGKVDAAAYYTDEAGENYAYESDISVAVYTQGNTKGYRVELGNGGSVVKSMISKSSDKTATYLDTNGTLVNLGAKAVSGADVDADPNTISFVLLKVFDDRVQAAYSIVLDEDAPQKFAEPKATPTPAPTATPTAAPTAAPGE